MTLSRFQKQIRFLQNRLSPRGYAGLHLTVGVLVVLFCGWCFGEIAQAYLMATGLCRLIETSRSGFIGRPLQPSLKLRE